MTIKGIFFDLDNTLWDFSRSAGKALDMVYQKYLGSIGVDRVAWQTSYREHNERLWQEYREGREVSNRVKYLRFLQSFADMGIETTDEAIEEVSSFFLKAIVDNTELFPSTKETLSLLKEDYILGVITNGFAASYARLDALDLRGLFTVLVTSEQVGRPKPDKLMFSRAISEAGLNPQEVVYVGDDYESDIVGAKRAGLYAVLFNHKNLPVPLEGEQPDYIIYELSQLIDIFLPENNKPQEVAKDEK